MTETEVAPAGQIMDTVPIVKPIQEVSSVEDDSAADEVPNSQSSSSTIESAASPSYQTQNASQETTQSLHSQPVRADLSDNGPQRDPERPLRPFGTSHHQALSPPSKATHVWAQPLLPALNVRDLPKENYHPSHGQKRTASGEVKPSSASQTTSPIDTTWSAQPRQMSATSVTTPISELSAQLRNRLSYAMLKVKNGWENKTFDEVESLASQHGSPKSAFTSPKQPFASPPTSSVDLYRERLGFTESSVRTTAPSERSIPAPHLHKHTLSHDHAYTQPPQPAHSPPRRPVDYPYLQSPHTPSLAPPVDFSSKHPRRSNPSSHHTQPSLLNGVRQHSNLSTSSTSSARSPVIPATPPQTKRPPAIKTPRQDKATAMEKDAIETLLFMSSPGNSQRQAQFHNNANTLPGTPLRSGFHSHNEVIERHVEFATAGEEAIPISPRKKGVLEMVGRLETDEDVERLLDEMGDEGSSSEDEEIGKSAISAPRHGLYS